MRLKALRNPSIWIISATAIVFTVIVFLAIVRPYTEVLVPYMAY